MIQQDIWLGGIMQCKLFDDLFVNIMIGNAGRDGKPAGAKETFIKVEGLQSQFRDWTDAGIGCLFNGTANHDAGKVSNFH